MRVLIVVIASMAAWPANAFCVEGYASNFADKVDNAINYLVCLHNEQANALNRHKDVINSQASDIERIEKRVGDDALSLLKVLEENQQLRNDLKREQLNREDLETALSSLEARVKLLDAKLPKAENPFDALDTDQNDPSAFLLPGK